MGKKKVEVLFKVDLVFEEKAKVTKVSLKGFLEEHIKGLKVTGYDNFTQTKDTTKTEVLTNVISLLHAEDMIKDASHKSPSGPDDLDETKGSIADKLLAKIRVVLASYNDKTKRKAVMENIDKLLEPIENKAMELCAHLEKLQNENTQLRVSMDNMQRFQTASVSQVSKSLTEAQMDQTASLLKNLESENARLQRRLVEYDDKMKIYEKNTGGDRVLLERISELDKKIQSAEKLHAEQLKEQEDRYNMRVLESMEKDDKIRELESSVGGSDKEQLVNTKKEMETCKNKLAELEEKTALSEKDLAETKTRLAQKEEANRQLTAELAKSLDGAAQLDEKLKSLNKELAEVKSRLGQAQASPVPTAAVLQKESPDSRKPSLEIPAAAVSKTQTSSTASGEETERCGKRLAEVEAELKSKDNKLSHLTSLLAAKEEEVVKCMDDYKTIQEYFLKCEREMKLAQQQLETVAQEKLTLQRQWESADTHATNANMEGSALKDKIAKLEGQITKKEEEKIRLAKMVAERNEIIRTNEDRFVEYEANKEELTKIIASLQERLHSSSASGSVPATAAGGSDLVLKLEEYREKIKELQDLNKQKTEELRRMQKSGSSEEGKESLLIRLRECERQLETAKTEAAMSQKAVEELGLQTQNLQQRNETLKRMAETGTKLPKENQRLIHETETSRTKQGEELNALKLKILELETQLIDKANVSPPADKSLAELQNEVISLKKQLIEQQQKLLKEQLGLQRELEKQQAAAIGLSGQAAEKDTALAKCETEIRSLQETVRAKEAQIAELARRAKDYDQEFRNLQASVKSGGTMSQEVTEYLGEIVYLYKTVTGMSKERIEEKRNKLARVQSLSKILADMSDKKITRDKLKSIVLAAMPQFPHLSGFDIKADYKYIVMSLLKVIGHKMEKKGAYEAECERNEIVLNYAEPKLKAYSEKINALQSRRKA